MHAAASFEGPLPPSDGQSGGPGLSYVPVVTDVAEPKSLAHAVACAEFGVPNGEGPNVCTAYQPDGISTVHPSFPPVKYVVPSGAEKHQVEESFPVALKQPHTGNVTPVPVRQPFATSKRVPVNVCGICVEPSGGMQTNAASVATPPLASRSILASGAINALLSPLHPDNATRATAATTERGLIEGP